MVQSIFVRDLDHELEVSNRVGYDCGMSKDVCDGSQRWLQRCFWTSADGLFVISEMKLSLFSGIPAGVVTFLNQCVRNLEFLLDVFYSWR